MKSDEIQSLFATAIKTYAPVEGKPLDPDLSTLQEALTALLLTITYDGKKCIHNLVSIVMNEDAYKTRYSANLPTPARPDSNLGRQYSYRREQFRAGPTSIHCV